MTRLRIKKQRSTMKVSGCLKKGIPGRILWAMSFGVIAASGAGGKIGEKKIGVDIGKEAAIEAEVRASRERALVPLETRVKSFKEMLKEKDVSAFSTWEKELHKIVFDPRYLLLTSRERKQVFEKYVKERAEEERREKRNKMRQKREDFRALMESASLHGK